MLAISSTKWQRTRIGVGVVIGPLPEDVVVDAGGDVGVEDPEGVEVLDSGVVVEETSELVLVLAPEVIGTVGPFTDTQT